MKSNRLSKLLKKIRVVLIEDNRLLRDGIISMLKKEPDIVVAGSFDDSEFVIDKIAELKPDVLLLDLGLPDLDGFELVRSLKNEYPDIHVIVMDLVPIQEDIMQFVTVGVSGFILKDATIPEFTKTIRAVAAGEKILPAILTGSLFSQIVDYGVKEMGQSEVIESVRMTKREKEIIELIASGLANKEIAFQLNVSIYTVKSHVHNILEKMSLNTRVQIAIHSQSKENPSSRE